MIDYAVARRNMVESQIRPNKVTDPLLLAAFMEIPREQFLPKSRRGVAYVDEDIEVGEGRHLMEPMVLARLLQVAETRPSDIALDIGCATGYSTAVLARLCNTVVAVERMSAPQPFTRFTSSPDGRPKWKLTTGGLKCSSTSAASRLNAMRPGPPAIVDGSMPNSA